MNNDFLDLSEKIEQKKNGAITELKEAIEKYEAEIGQRKSSLAKRIEEKNTELNQAQKEQETLTQQFADKLSEDDIGSAKNIEMKILQAKYKADDQRHQIELLSSVPIKGDAALYADVRKYYMQYDDILASVASDYEDLKKQIYDTIISLQKTTKIINGKSLGVVFPDDSLTQRVLDIAEHEEGAIDVKGHHLRSDAVAKVHYLYGRLEGLEDTAAGRKLTGLPDEVPTQGQEAPAGINIETDRYYIPGSRDYELKKARRENAPQDQAEPKVTNIETDRYYI